MDPLKALAATVFCLVLFVLVLRLTRRLMEMAISAGHAEERRRLEQEALLDAETRTSADGDQPPAGHTLGAVP
ncbi:hypothetical protein [Methylobacterium aerolatum]|uniref:Uncharacterized protein n=1 Tax=Methylobacterium aerolatum TaxID=418708 RepID=A0ABU0I1L0_9HYPH|nr:hypothetical protein [Methylobacterium aerolatum]MDQ0448487.1 hypothetical protein [Methylobacterium aerolatum]GJD34568.1 hypothetical protein FMGBMHLM_1470 [Methylobacterium aerolatum]